MTPGLRTQDSGFSTGNPPQFDLRLLDSLGVKITRLTCDSRKLRPGDAFAAYPGDTQDGRSFIPRALAAGAAAVLWEPQGFSWEPEWRVPNLGVPGLRQALGVIASHVYGEPSQKLWVIGITGTNGKTSCSHWIAQAMTALGRQTAIVGTLGGGFPGALRPSINTTPDAACLHGQMADFLAQGARSLAMEVSSHALDQHRVNGVAFAVALFTNLSRDHLDYHGDMQRYSEAKARLFLWPRLKHAVLNLDDSFGVELARRLKDSPVEVYGYGFSEDGWSEAKQAGLPLVKGSNLRVSGKGLSFEVESPWGSGTLSSAIVGKFNAANLLAALATLLVSGTALKDALRALGQAQPVAGRMQRLGGGSKPLVVVDYAHTPDALEKVLTALREVMMQEAGARLICVFGCGGERDRGKRELMGDAASRLAHQVIVTSDNPRGEDPLSIINDIVKGMKGANYRVVEDRAAAIFQAIKQARAGDVLLVAGKGHEPYQEIKGVKLPFSDAEVAQKALDKHDEFE